MLWYKFAHSTGADSYDSTAERLETQTCTESGVGEEEEEEKDDIISHLYITAQWNLLARIAQIIRKLVSELRLTVDL